MIDDLPRTTRNRSLARHYQSIDLRSRIEGSTPHDLVAILYAELGIALEVMARADPQQSATFQTQYERAVSILLTLEGSLDPERGGSLAGSLAAIYRQMRKQLFASRTRPDALTEVRDGVASLAQAWAQISR